MESRSPAAFAAPNRYRQFTPANNNGVAIATVGGVMTIVGLVLKSVACHVIAGLGSALSLFCCFVCLIGCAEASGPENDTASRNAEPRRQMIV